MGDKDAMLGVQIDPEKKEQLEEMAYEMSSPSNRITVSDVVRGAIDDYLDNNE